MKTIVHLWLFSALLSTLLNKGGSTSPSMKGNLAAVSVYWAHRKARSTDAASVWFARQNAETGRSLRCAAKPCTLPALQRLLSDSHQFPSSALVSLWAKIKCEKHPNSQGQVQTWRHSLCKLCKEADSHEVSFLRDYYYFHDHRGFFFILNVGF